MNKGRLLEFIIRTDFSYMRALNKFNNKLRNPTLNDWAFTIIWGKGLEVTNNRLKALSHYANIFMQQSSYNMFHATELISCNLFHTTKPVSCQIFHVPTKTVFRKIFHATKTVSRNIFHRETQMVLCM